MITNIVLYIGILFSLTLLVAGHNEPGGGFVAGAMTASVFALLYLVFGKDYVESRFQTDYRSITAAGLLVTIFFALMPMALGEPVLSSILFTLDVPLVGQIELGSAVGFDFGIYLVVVGSVLTILRRSAGGEEPG
ncbi:MAG: MnhB domain-containing protein [Thermoplasmata archaeon]